MDDDDDPELQAALKASMETAQPQLRRDRRLLVDVR